MRMRNRGLLKRDQRKQGAKSESTRSNKRERRGIQMVKWHYWVFAFETTQGRKSKAHITNRLCSQVRIGPTALFLACTVGIKNAFTPNNNSSYLIWL